jgi:hypothetical protein
MKNTGYNKNYPKLCILIATGFLFIIGNSFCQGLYNNGATIQINNASVFANIPISNNGFLVNDGVVQFTQDWESPGKYSGKGVLEAYGNTPQKIAHYGQKVRHLHIKGWGTKFIKGRLSITHEFHLYNGIVRVSPLDMLRLQVDAVVYGGSPASYVDGALTVEGIGYKFFPIGKNGTYSPIEYLTVKGNTPEFSLEVFENAPVVSVDNAIVRNALYWQRTDLAGEFLGSTVAVSFEPESFEDRNKIILVAGTAWNKRFMSITEVEVSGEADKLTSLIDITAPIIMLGEKSELWGDSDFYFPTALSPNASHTQNQQVRIFGARLLADEFRFQVFNRWGMMVYESTSLEDMTTKGWDGRSPTGDKLVSGAYPYRITAVDKTGKPFEKRGVITIVY